MSEHTKRWNAPRGATIHESAKGEFVLYSDYAELEAQLAASQQREAELREIIAEARAQTNNYVIQELLEQVEYKALSGGG